jgi:hypothetical protein
MPDFLTRRNGTWHFVRRLPAEFTSFDRRSIIRHSTKVRVAEDRNGRRASRVAQKFNEQLEGYWCSLAHGLHNSQISRYEAARREARTLGFEYLENDQLIALPSEKRLERLDALVTKGVVDDPAARAALLGTEKRSVFRVSKLFEEYQSLVEVELKGMSRNQLRCWRLGRIRAVHSLWRSRATSPRSRKPTASIMWTGGGKGSRRRPPQAARRQDPEWCRSGRGPPSYGVGCARPGRRANRYAAPPPSLAPTFWPEILRATRLTRGRREKAPIVAPSIGKEGHSAPAFRWRPLLRETLHAPVLGLDTTKRKRKSFIARFITSLYVYARVGGFRMEVI